MDSFSMSINPNKLLKEEFVSNLSGSSMLEIASLSTIVPLLFLLRHSFPANWNTWTLSKKDDNDVIFASKSVGAYLSAITLDFLFIILPSLVALTVLADWTYLFAALLTVIIFSIAAKSSSSSSVYSNGTTLSLRDNISSYRINVMVTTCLCILAVDFRIFPRRYAKTETYGTSLMDIGVGSFVLVNALVSRQARGVSSMDWKIAIRSSSPLLLLGFARLLSTRSVDYQVHASEYGVHWNFFFTLAAVAVLTSIINIPPQYSGILGLVILISYQCWLISGLNEYLLSDKRGTDIISKNKEGIFSILGYWGMYLVGVQLGYNLFFGRRSSTILNKWERIRVSFLSLIFWLITALLDRHVERVSRRMCNLSYVTLVLAQNFQVLGILMLSDHIPGSKISALEEAYNGNLLGSFLLANLLTGVVNLCMDTLFIPSLFAVIILTCYAYALSVIVGIAHFYGLRFKFW